MIFPSILTPNAFENFTIQEKIIQIPKCNVELESWKGNPLNFTFGGKAVLSFEGYPMFAELVIMNIFKNNGWNTRWIETYGKPKLNPICLTDWVDIDYKSQIHKPIDNKLVNLLIHLVAKNNQNTFGGCWDVIAWKNDDIIFAETKKNKKDRIRSTQKRWLESALEIGFKVDNFLMVEWDLK